jgi:hypothetical protein
MPDSSENSKTCFRSIGESTSEFKGYVLRIVVEKCLVKHPCYVAITGAVPAASAAVCEQHDSTSLLRQAQVALQREVLQLWRRDLIG